MEKEEPLYGANTMGLVLLCVPIGFAIWYVPLIYADIIGFLPAFLIIAGILTIIIVVGRLAISAKPTPDHRPETKQKTYTV